MVASVSNTAAGIITDAMRVAGLIGKGQTPDSQDFSDNLRTLNDVINLWQTQGLKLFQLEDISVPLVSGQNTYSFAPSGSVDMTKPLRALQGYILDATTNIRRPINPLSWDEYMRLSQLTDNEGMINSFFVNKQTPELYVLFWNTPDATEAANTAHLLMQTQVTNPAMLTEDMAFPQEWRIALQWGLAAEICTGQPQAVINRCEEKAERYRTMLENWDVEDTQTRFVLDSRMQSGGNSFR